jgi:hypothetical protein
VLSYDTQPAIIMTASFSLMDKIETGVDAHLPVAQYYDVPGSRPLVCLKFVLTPPPFCRLLSMLLLLENEIGLTKCTHSMRNSLLPIINQHPEMMKSIPSAACPIPLPC